MRQLDEQGRALGVTHSLGNIVDVALDARARSPACRRTGLAPCTPTFLHVGCIGMCAEPIGKAPVASVLGDITLSARRVAPTPATPTRTATDFEKFIPGGRQFILHGVA
ncbi:MAG: hypothetical protein KF811_09565 [Dokdonella sp.]|nr:hypothetical protein [Dokdonella sp.]MCB1573162.1 hypothetical protein [Xanthomonadales bacterium]MCB1576073.1 hypothetical protein [Xanthomonadales bacterium]